MTNRIQTILTSLKYLNVDLNFEHLFNKTIKITNSTENLTSNGKVLACLQDFFLFPNTDVIFGVGSVGNRVSGQGFFLHFWEKAPGQNWEKIFDLTSKLGEINNIDHNKGSKIYSLNLF